MTDTQRQERELDLSILESLVLKHGEHEERDQGVCALEAVAWIAGEPHTDHPECVCPVLGAFGRAWNDGLPDDETRTRLLKPYLPRMVGTAGDTEASEQRAWLATDWLVRVCTPAFLELSPSLREHAQALSGLPPVTSREAVSEAEQKIDAARDAAWAAARAAARDAARDAARAAARDAAWAAAWAAARAAARDAAGAAAWDAARAAAGAAAWDALQPTVERLQRSAQDLLERMLSVGETA